MYLTGQRVITPERFNLACEMMILGVRRTDRCHALRLVILGLANMNITNQ